MSTDTASLHDGKYDDVSASNRLDDIINDRTEKALPLPSQWLSAYEEGRLDGYCGSAEDNSYRFASDDEQIVFRLPGIVTQAKLPPFADCRLTSSNLAYLQQTVGLAGFRSKAYKTEVYALQDILDIVKECSPHQVNDNKNPTYASTTTFSNRMFSRKETNGPAPHAMSRFIDPDTKLGPKAARQGLVHTWDNNVEYSRLHRGSYKAIAPRSIRLGDIIEVHFTVALFKTQNETYLPKLLLRAIISLDISFTRNALRLIQDVPVAPPDPVISLKRKRGILQDIDMNVPSSRTRYTTAGVEGDSMAAAGASNGDVTMSTGVGAVQHGISNLTINPSFL